MLRLLAIGNSFSNNATDYLPRFAEAQGRRLILGHASNGGWSLQRHWDAAAAHDADSEDLVGKPYAIAGMSTPLKAILRREEWDIVTLQQHSWTAPDASTYQPFGRQLAAYVRLHAPQAEIWVHQTWAYRVDHSLMAREGITQQQMYERLRDAYQAFAQEIGAARIIPTATAFQNVRHDPRWGAEIEPGFDPASITYPNLPRQNHSLVTGWYWDTKQSPPTLAYDGKHCSPAGKYLGTVVWYHTLFGEAPAPPFVPAELNPDDAAILCEIGRRTALDREPVV